MTEGPTPQFESKILPGKTHPISLHTAVEHNDKIYIFGGVDTCIIPQNKFVVLDKNTRETEEIVSKNGPLERCGHISFVHNDKIYIHGGKQHGETFEDFFTYDLKEKEWKEIKLGENTIVIGRCFHSFILHENQLFIYGGITKTATKQNFLKFDFSENKWTELDIKGTPEQRFGQSMNLKDGSKIIMFGGECKSVPQNTIYEFDIVNNTWEEIKPVNTDVIPAGRSKHSSFIMDNSLYVFGGHLGNGIYKNELFKFDFESKTWSEVHFKGFPLAGQGMSLTRIDDTSFYILGGHKGTLVGTGDCEGSIILLKKIEK